LGRTRRGIYPDLLNGWDRPKYRLEHWTVHLDFLTDDLEAAVRQESEAGAALVREFQERIWGRMANMVDPFDNPFDLIELSIGGYDRIDYVHRGK